jgi:hypothetical protein
MVIVDPRLLQTVVRFDNLTSQIVYIGLILYISTTWHFRLGDIQQLCGPNFTQF